jgi:hypothetical protein
VEVSSVSSLVEALRYKQEGCGFDSQWGHLNCSLTWPFQPHYGPGIDLAWSRNEYQGYLLGGKGGRCVGLTTLPPSRAYCPEIVGAWTSWSHMTCAGMYRDWKFTQTCLHIVSLWDNIFSSAHGTIPVCFCITCRCKIIISVWRQALYTFLTRCWKVLSTVVTSAVAIWQFLLHNIP